MKSNQELVSLLKDLLNDYPVTSYCRMQCIDPSKNHYKYYIIEIKEAVGGGFNLTCTYGRINSTKVEKVYIKNGTEKSCKTEAEKIRRKKLNSGYQEVESGMMRQGLTKIV